MIIKIYRERGKNKKSMRRRELVLTRIILHHHKNFRETHPNWKRNDKNKTKLGVATILS
jgi:arginine deiminase